MRNNSNIIKSEFLLIIFNFMKVFMTCNAAIPHINLILFFNNVINQYIIFCKVFNEQTKQHGMTQKAVTETIRICKDRNVLMEYLPGREKEVVSIMMSLFDEEQIMKSFIRSERHEEARETAERMIKMGKLSIDEIALCAPSLSLDELRELEAEVMQLA